MCLYSVKSSEGFIQGWVNPSDSLWMQAHANVLLPQRVFFLTGDVQFGLGAGSEGGLSHRANQGLLNMSSEP